MSNIFVNKFNQGASENSNIGIGTMLGVETYSKSGTLVMTAALVNSDIISLLSAL